MEENNHVPLMLGVIPNGRGAQRRRESSGSGEAAVVLLELLHPLTGSRRE